MSNKVKFPSIILVNPFSKLWSHLSVYLDLKQSISALIAALNLFANELLGETYLLGQSIVLSKVT